MTWQQFTEANKMPADMLSTQFMGSDLVTTTTGEQTIQFIAVNQLQPIDNQPRKSFDEETIKELAQSIHTYGILQPLIVFYDNQNQIRIIAGERRWRAAKLIGLDVVPCLFRSTQEHSHLELSLIENIQREALSPLEEAEALQQLLEEHQYTQEGLALKLGKKRTSVTNSIRLLSLPTKIKADLEAKQITAGHAKALCALDSEKNQLKIHQMIVSKKLSVRQTEDLIKGFKEEKKAKKLGDMISPDLRYICDQFKGHLGTKVKISGNADQGKIEISYYTSDDLERISDLILT